MRLESMRVFFWVLLAIIVLGFIYVLYVGFFGGEVKYSPRGGGENSFVQNQPCGNVFFCETSADCPNSESCINGVCLT